MGIQHNMIFVIFLVLLRRATLFVQTTPPKYTLPIPLKPLYYFTSASSTSFHLVSHYLSRSHATTNVRDRLIPITATA